MNNEDNGTTQYWRYSLIGFNKRRRRHMYSVTSTQTGITKEIELVDKLSLNDVLLNIAH